MDTYNQFKICAGLYGLADRFHEVFSTIKGAVSIGQVSSLENLIRSLANGERTVIDGLRNMTDMLADSARELDKLPDGPAFDEKRQQLLERVDLEKKDLKSQTDWLNRTVRDVLTKM